MDYLSLLYCLSTLSGVRAESYVTILKSRIKYATGAVKNVWEFYIETYEESRSFPDFSLVVAKFGLDVTAFSLDAIRALYGSTDHALSVLWDKYKNELDVLELKSIESQLFAETDLTEKKKLLSSYTRLFSASSASTEITALSDTDIDVVGTRNLENEIGLTWPIAHLNETLGPLRIGENATIIGGPGSFKTSFAINMLYQNSVLRPFHGLYIYLEDLPESYQKKLVSRFSYGIGHRLSKDLFLRGTDDPALLASMNLVWDKYRTERKGRISYLSMANFDTDPLAFAHQFGLYTTQHEVDYVVFDYAQRMRAYTPSAMSEFMYLNHFFSALTNLALGGYNNRKFAAIILSQLTKEGERKAAKTKGRLSMADAAEINSLERDAFVMLSLFADDEMKAAGSMVYQTLKARNGETSEEPTRMQCSPEYVFVGDVADMEDTYTVDTMSSAFSPEDYGL